MKTAVTVVDYGVGNLYSVARALEKVGGEVVMADSAQGIAEAGSLLLPGVGSFSSGMQELRGRGLIQPLLDYAASGKPFLGICLGMQMMFEGSEEFGEHRGMGLISGRVASVPAVGQDGRPHKIPHIGWNNLNIPPARRDWQGTLLEGVGDKAAMYFVHSFTAIPARPEDRLADCDYDGCLISAAVQVGNLCGCQFHPEKSGETGLRILRNFLAMG